MGDFGTFWGSWDFSWDFGSFFWDFREGVRRFFELRTPCAAHFSSSPTDLLHAQPNLVHVAVRLAERHRHGVAHLHERRLETFGIFDQSARILVDGVVLQAGGHEDHLAHQRNAERRQRQQFLPADVRAAAHDQPEILVGPVRVGQGQFDELVDFADARTVPLIKRIKYNNPTIYTSPWQCTPCN